MLLGHPHLCARRLAEDPIPHSRLCCVNFSFFEQLAHAHDFALSTAEAHVGQLSYCGCAVDKPPTIKYHPDADFLSMSSQAQFPSRCASTLYALPDFGKKVAKSFVSFMYLTVLTNCLNDFRVWVPEPLAHPSRCGLQVRPAPRHGESSSHCGPTKIWMITGITVYRLSLFSRAWDSSMDGNLSSSSSTARTIRTCPVLIPTCHTHVPSSSVSPSELQHARTSYRR